eukprot:gnl/TRDRNA2_/TRDRNA2_173854_c2_seq3.p1 gnl/TRDRNA2_/TRDRNA2_173854_c2~~gnl/TRDRNA2_/TRDRNA2_173854_c2_seq3.p1  ORF type:complete len:350 (-),score=117.29 gnl/TRDRNA2_/TRDRNA2_173854_c2_seq3:69-1118(-)
MSSVRNISLVLTVIAASWATVWAESCTGAECTVDEAVLLQVNLQSLPSDKSVDMANGQIVADEASLKEKENQALLQKMVFTEKEQEQSGEEEAAEEGKGHHKKAKGKRHKKVKAEEDEDKDNKDDDEKKDTETEEQHDSVEANFAKGSAEHEQNVEDQVSGVLGRAIRSNHLEEELHEYDEEVMLQTMEKEEVQENEDEDGDEDGEEDEEESEAEEGEASEMEQVQQKGGDEEEEAEEEKRHKKSQATNDRNKGEKRRKKAKAMEEKPAALDEGMFKAPKGEPSEHAQARFWKKKHLSAASNALATAEATETGAQAEIPDSRDGKGGDTHHPSTSDAKSGVQSEENDGD